jgi:hypothetical protein
MLKLKWSHAALLIIFALIGCSAPAGSDPATTPSTPAPTSTPIPGPTATPIPQVLLIAKEAVPWEDELTAWVLSSGWDLVKPDVPGAAAYLKQSSAPIAAVSVGEALDGELERAATRGLSIVAVDVPGITAGPSLSVVRNTRHDQAGFLAGVMTGLASQTGWVGQITATGGEHEADYSAGFVQGLLWGCPKCQLISQTAAEMTLDRFLANTVDVAFPFPGPEAAWVAETLTSDGLPMVWVGEEGPTGDALVGRVIVFEEAVAVIIALEDLITTGEGSVWQSSIEIQSIFPLDINPKYLSPGRQRLLYEVYESIAAGELDIGTESDA